MPIEGTPRLLNCPVEEDVAGGGDEDDDSLSWPSSAE